MKTNVRIWSAALAAMLVACYVASASNVDALIRKLSGPDEKARSLARQLLPREPVDTVSKVIPLLKSPDPAVWNAAYNVLVDFAGEASAPGREKDRVAVTDQLMTLVAPDQPTAIKIRGLRLLPLVVPEGHSVAPMATLLKDPVLKDKARVALQETGTAKAGKALERDLSRADPAFQCALLDSLGLMHNAHSLSRIVRYTKSRNPKVRVAAARALAWSGQAKYEKAVRAVYSRATPETAFDAADAMIRFADALAGHSDSGDAPAALYREVLNRSKSENCRGSALVGLVRYGDSGAAKTIVAALKGASDDNLEPVVLSAFENARGPAVTARALAVYPKVSREMRIGLLGVFGEKQDAAFQDTLTAATRDADSTIRRAAISALADSGLPSAVAPLAVAAKANVDDRGTALTALQSLAAHLGAHGAKMAAGRAYVSVYANANTPELRRTALAGMARYPTPESSEILMKGIETGKLKNASTALLAGLTLTLTQAGHKAEADRAMKLLMARATTPDAIADVINVVRETKSVPDIAHRLGFVTSWRLAGPFPWSMSNAFKVTHVNEPNVDVKAVYHVKSGDISWKPFKTGDDSGIVDLISAFGDHSNATGYGVSTVSVPAATSAVARIGSDDGVKLWVNGVAVHENNTDRGLTLDQDKAPIKLKAGANTLLVEITQGAGGWNFCLRLTKPDGSPLAFTPAN